ncbi:hypothetical protein HK101_001041 [Irineochytrium annulatum]|nr:hypothetical protein HK101_001041 [Irineochytrium annulatum]
MELQLHPVILYRIQLVDVLIEPAADNWTEDCRFHIVIECRLTSEMGLFRRGDRLPAQIACDLVTRSSSGITLFTGATLELHNGCGHLDERGKCRLAGTLTTNTDDAATPFFIHLHAPDATTIMPLVEGPLAVSGSDPDVERTVLRPFDVSGTKDTLMIRERFDSGIHGRVWDSCVMLCGHLGELLRCTRRTSAERLRVLDLACGVGVVGILAGCLRADTEVVLTELPDALEQARDNAWANEGLLAMGSSVDVKPLVWGDVDAATALGKFDIIFASDVVYENEFFMDLITTLKLLSHAETSLVLVYKKRGLAQDEEMAFFQRLFVDFETTRGDEPSFTSDYGCRLYELHIKAVV